MAVILSNGTSGGSWATPGTWAGGVVPNIGLDDDAQIVSGDIVLWAAIELELAAGRTIEVLNGGTLSLNGGELDITGDLEVTGQVAVSGTAVNVNLAGIVTVNATGLLRITGFTMNTSGTIDILSGGEFRIELSSVLNCNDGSVTIRSGATLHQENQGDLEVNGAAVVFESASTIEIINNSEIRVLAGTLVVNGDVVLENDCKFTVTGVSTTTFSRRERGVKFDGDDHLVIDYSRAYGFAANAMRIG